MIVIVDSLEEQVRGLNSLNVTPARHARVCIADGADGCYSLSVKDIV